MLLSIVIPTKNRYSTLIPVLHYHINNLNNDNIEIIVEDNSTDNYEFLSQDLYTHPSIKYNYNSKHLSVTENTNLALSRATGEYVIFIGDDDFLHPDVLTIVLHLKELGGPCLIYSCGNYWWPNVKFLSVDNFFQPACLWLPQKISTDFRIVDSSSSLKHVLEKGACSYYNLPRLYHGIVSKSTLNDLRVKFGDFVIGSSPDMSLAMCLSFVLGSYYYLDFPVSFFGASQNSGGGWTVSGSHHGPLDKKPHLPKDIIKRWHPNLPRYWSETLIYAQTCLEILRLMEGETHLKLNYVQTFAHGFVHEPVLRKTHLRGLSRFARFNLILYVQFSIGVVLKYFGIVQRTFLRVLNINTKLAIHGVVDLNQVHTQIKKNNISFLD